MLVECGLGITAGLLSVTLNLNVVIALCCRTVSSVVMMKNNARLECGNYYGLVILLP